MGKVYVGKWLHESRSATDDLFDNRNLRLRAIDALLRLKSSKFSVPGQREKLLALVGK